MDGSRMEADVLGFSLRFPESETPSAFWQNLINGVDMQTTDNRRWPIGLYNTPPRQGKIPNFDAFDNGFFSVHGKQAQRLDPQARKLLEAGYEAWMDSGIDFNQLRGSAEVGVYVGACGSDAQAIWLWDIPNITGYEQTGCTGSMFANRLSWYFDFCGPSKVVDSACSSSLLALHDAVADLAAGRVNYAMVGGSSAILSPSVSKAFNELHMLSPEGACKSFDAAGNGYTRADGIAVVILRRPGVVGSPCWMPKQPLARILSIGTNNDGYTKESITFPSGAAQAALARQVLRESGVSAADVVYVEAHGTGTVAGDGQELGSIDSVYGSGDAQRSPANPLLIGSVKSNMGHCEGGSGLAALSKVLLSFEHGLLPPNLHYREANPNSESLRNGTLKVVTEATPFAGGIVAISNFGFGGSNVHMLVQGNARSPMLLPSPVELSDVGIIPLAARTADGMAKLVDELKALLPNGPLPFAAPLARLANGLLSNVALQPMRGALLPSGECTWGQTTTSTPTPVWFAFGGNGSQWAGMARELLEENPTFRDSVSECAAVVQIRHGLDLLEQFDDLDGFADPVSAAVGLAATQIALVDVLKEDYGITPAGVFGHSAGEITCGYADGAFTREQTMRVAYERAANGVKYGSGRGLMASVGLSADAADARLARAGTPSIVVACDNSPSNVTLSGPATDLRPLLDSLRREGVFVREIETRGMAYHSSDLDPGLPALRSALEDLMPLPIRRSEQWISTTFPPDTTEAEAKLSSAAYQVHGYRNRVLFRQGCEQLPKGVVVLEIGPHAILRSLIRQCRRDLPHVATLKKGENSVHNLQSALVELWKLGASVRWPVPSVAALDCPVPRSVREALVSWDHRTLLPLPNPSGKGASEGFSKTFHLAGKDAYLVDHNIDGRVILPATSYLVTAWEALAMQKQVPKEDLPVIFEDVHIFQAVQADVDSPTSLSVMLDRAHRFQVLHSGDLIAEGKIRVAPSSRVTPVTSNPELEQSRNQSNSADAANVGEARVGGGEASTASNLGGQLQSSTDTLLSASASDAGAHPRAGDAAPTQGAARPLVMGRWTLPDCETAPGEAFYRNVGRSGIHYGEHFQVVQKIGSGAKKALMRWDGCFIRFLDGLLQVTALDLDDFLLRVPVRLRQVAILDPNPNMAPGSTVVVELDRVCQTCKSTLAKLAGIDMAVASRKPPKLQTKVCRVQWVPYGERCIDAPFREQTHDAVLALIKDGLLPKLSGMKADGILPPHLNNVLGIVKRIQAQAPSQEFMDRALADPQCIFGRILAAAFGSPEVLGETLKDPVKAITMHPEHERLYVDDIVARGFSDAELKIAADIIVENMSPDGFNAVEIGAGTGGLTRQLLPMLTGSLHQSPLIKYVATDVSAAFGPLLQASVGAPELDFQVWDVNDAAPVSLGGPFNLVTSSNAIHACNNLAETLHHIYNVLAEDGFLLFYEYTGMLTCCLWGLSEECWRFTDERDYGLWISLDRWKRLLSQAGFEPVSIARARGEAGALFLYRKVPKGNRGASRLLPAPRLPSSVQEMDAWIQTYNSNFTEVTHFQGNEDNPFYRPDQAQAMPSRKLPGAGGPHNPSKPDADPGAPVNGVHVRDGGSEAGLGGTHTPACNGQCYCDMIAGQMSSGGEEGENAHESATSPVNAADGADDVEVETRLWLWGTGETNPGLAGMNHSLRLEPGGLRVRTIMDIGPCVRMDAAQMLAASTSLDLVMNVFRDGVNGSYRTLPIQVETLGTSETVDGGPHGAHMDLTEYGNLSSIIWVRNPPPQAGCVEASVTYGSLNFKDVMLAYGKLPRDAMGQAGHVFSIGIEFSGTLEKAATLGGVDYPAGQRVMGSAVNAMATKVAVPGYKLFPVPDAWSLAEAATVPVAYSTAYFALVMRGGLKAGQRVLIHSGSGAVGLAAIRICLSRKCEVFTTCGSAAKREFLLGTFPQLDDDHIGDSRSCDFEATVMTATKGAGVHLCLNSLDQDKLQASVRCLANFGTLLEIGKFDMVVGSSLPMRAMLRGVSYISVHLEQMYDEGPAADLTLAWELHRILAEGLQAGDVQPLPFTIFAREQAEAAFRFLSKGMHIGKAMLQMKADVPPEAHADFNILKPPGYQLAKGLAGDDDELVPPPASSPLVVRPVWRCRPGHTYIITGGLGGFGLALARCFARQGATHLVLTSSRGIRTGPQHHIVNDLRSQGLHVEVSLLDVGVRQQARQLLQFANSVAPLAGIFHLAMVLKDKLMSNQTGEGWNGCVVPKAMGARHLDQESRSLNRPLDAFVVFSSAIVEMGNPGQANYAYANAACNEVCEARAADGVAGVSVSIQWGVVDDVGFVAEQDKGKVASRLFSAKMQPQPVDDCLRLLGHLLAGGTATPPVVASHAAELAGKKEDGEVKDLVTAVLDIMGLKQENLGENEDLSKMGIDSMQVVEVRAVVQRALGRPFPIEEIGTLSLAKLRTLAAEINPDVQVTAATGGVNPAAAEAASPPRQPAPVSKEAEAAADELDALLGLAEE